MDAYHRGRLTTELEYTWLQVFRRFPGDNLPNTIAARKLVE